MLFKYALPLLGAVSAVSALRPVPLRNRRLRRDDDEDGPTVYLIRHGEKPEDGGQGLSAEGEQRAQCLRTVFGAESQYNIGYIIAEQPQEDGDRTRPLETVQPLADDLGLEPDISCDKEDPECVADLVFDYEGDGNILICWQHGYLTDIVEELGADEDDAPEYDDDEFDIIWTDYYDYEDGVTEFTSENCPGLDD